MQTRYGVPTSPTVADGWHLTRLTAASRLFGANGLRTGPDGRVYIAQVTGSQISALDVDTGDLATVSAKGGDIIAPDDVAFDIRGNLFATEVMDGRVSVRDAKGTTRVLRDDVPSANGITFHRGRLFIGECREGGRLMEFDPDGGPPRILLEDVPSPNAMEVGPDGLLYFPVMGANEIWRIDPDGSHVEIVATGLGVPDSVKFDADGFIVSTQVASGQVLRIDPRTGAQTVLAQLTPGLDNCTFADGRLFVSNFTGEITEILGDGATRTTLPGALNWPLDLEVGDDGRVYVADGTYLYAVGPDGSLQTVGMLFSPGYPGFLRGLVRSGPGEFVVTTSGGQITRYRPATDESDVLAAGFDQLYGIALTPGGVVAVEQGTGQVVSVDGHGGVEVVAKGLDRPVGVTVTPGGDVLVAESGRVVRVTPAGVETVVDGLRRPQGLLARGGELVVVDAGEQAVLSVDLTSGARTVLASGLPIGPPPGVEPKPLRGMPPFSGPQGPFAGIAAGPDGTLYVSADGEGSVLVLTRERA
ncbi:gluconolaconase [Mycolicibacterium madagascariense]|uniref:Gluconolaconase n=1 Tax=Mycolicibacterium madagascariense TaxID=212765 RepID=A0A7I7XBI1_9MYCO|nr:SMP-30/gluconolactonase/LRE family protein [Mycolicibacterium madagascariense]MCV7015704.1 SMP-30/gluconolactonase/LRE family protein [Mycolicibacterium madagascariense]BBZ27119.1 gluconolaconase [Mycolicibacterium madagascariense]